MENISIADLESKTVWSFEEAVFYSPFSENYMRDIISKGLVPGICKPLGKIITIDSVKFRQWLLSNPQMTKNEIENLAQHYLDEKTK